MNRRGSSLFVWAGTVLFVVYVSIHFWAGNPVTAQSLLDMVVFALPFAGIYAMTASGLVVVYTTTGIFNFAQGAIGMFMAFVYWQLSSTEGGWGWPTWIAIPLVVLVIAPLFGIALDRAIMRHLQGQSLVVQLTVTIGLMFALIGVAGMIWDQTVNREVTHLFGDTSGFSIGNTILLWHRLLVVVLAIALAIGLRLFLFSTRPGIAMRASVDNRPLASLAGARAARLSSFSWALGCSLAALAGVLLAPEVNIVASGPLTLLVITSFAAAVVGRLRSLPLTYLGAVILALARAYSVKFLSFPGAWTNVKDVLPAITLFIVLLLLPTATLRFAQVRSVKRIERVPTVRDTAMGMAAFFLLMAFVTGFLSANRLSNFSVGMCTALVALSLVPLIGWAGQVSLAPLAFAGIGAASYTRLGGAHGSVWALLLAALVCVPVGALLALPALRLQGLYLALLTLAFASLVEQVYFGQSWALGLLDRNAGRLDLFGYHFGSERTFLLLLTGVFGILAVLVVALRRSAFGRRLVALRDSEAATATVGVNIVETKLVVFMLSAGMAGFAGAFFAMELSPLSSQNTYFTMLQGLAIVLALVIGGVACVSGALFAGMFGLLNQLIQDNWHITLWKQLTFLAPGLAAFGIIANPSGAVVAIGNGFARFLPWRTDAQQEYEEEQEAAHETEVGELGLSRGFEDADVLQLDRGLGISNEVPRAASRSA